MSLPSADFWNSEFCNLSPELNVKRRSADEWSEKAGSFAHKPKRSGYLEQLVEKLDLAPGTSVFDMGCGPGTLAVPLAARGCTVAAVDFAAGMLDELRKRADGAGVSDAISTYRRSWEDD